MKTKVFSGVIEDYRRQLEKFFTDDPNCNIISFTQSQSPGGAGATYVVATLIYR